MNNHRPNVGIIGAGIIGVSTACFLVEKGFTVTLVDPHAPGQGGASKGNAAQIFPALVHPLASPATLKNALAFLANPMGPLFIPLHHLPRMLPWLGGFIYAARRKNFQRAASALEQLNHHCHADFTALLHRAGCATLLKDVGAIQLYESPQTLHAGFDLWSSVSDALTGGVEKLECAHLHDREPALGACIKGGVLIRHTGILADPAVVVTSLFDYARRAGKVSYLRDRVQKIRAHREHVKIRGESGNNFTVDRLVITAGAWSGPLLRQLNEPHSIQAERGYNLTLATDGAAIHHNLVFAERGVVATPLPSGDHYRLRVGGWDEFAGTDAPSNPRIFAKIERLAHKLLPGFDWHSGERWMGHRASLPDTLPVIGQSRKHKAVYYGFAHGHLGMTQGPTTGKALAALIAGTPPAFDLSPFAPRRGVIARVERD